MEGTDLTDLMKEIRRESGLSLRDLGERAGTSAATLSYYASGKKEPRLSTLRRVADAAGLDLEISLVPRLTAAERRTLALHQAVAERLKADPDGVRRRARQNLEVIRQADHGGHGALYNDAWSDLLEGPLDRLLPVLTGTDAASRRLRQSSPFAGILSDEERLAILRRERAAEPVA